MSQFQSNDEAEWTMPSITPTAADDQAIRDTVFQFTAAWNKHDPQEMAAIWAHDGDLINPWGRTASGRPEVEQLFADEQQGPMKQSAYQMNVTSLRILNGELAVLDADSAITGMYDADGKEATFKPHVFLVLGKADGKWSILAARPYAFSSKPGSIQ